jgi:hypothetical protein
MNFSPRSRLRLPKLLRFFETETLPASLRRLLREQLSLRKFHKHVDITSQQEAERIAREDHVEKTGMLKLKMVLTTDVTAPGRVVEDV